MSAIAPAADAAAAPKFELTGSRQFPEWLAEQRLSLAFTTYQSGKLFLIGLSRTGGCRCSSARSTAAWASPATARRCG